MGQNFPNWDSELKVKSHNAVIILRQLWDIKFHKLGRGTHAFTQLYCEDIKRAVWLHFHFLSLFILVCSGCASCCRKIPHYGEKTQTELCVELFWLMVCASEKQGNQSSSGIKITTFSTALCSSATPLHCCVSTSVFCYCVGSFPALLPPTIWHFSLHWLPSYTIYSCALHKTLKEIAVWCNCYLMIIV